MSTSPYSIDLRKKVIGYIVKGNSQKQASEVFNIHKNTISRWHVRYQEEGVLEARFRLGFKSKVDKKGLEEFVMNNPNSKLAELGKRYGVTASQVSRILRRLGFSYKKKPLPMWKRVSKSVPII